MSLTGDRVTWLSGRWATREDAEGRGGVHRDHVLEVYTADPGGGVAAERRWQ